MTDRNFIKYEFQFEKCCNKHKLDKPHPFTCLFVRANSTYLPIFCHAHMEHILNSEKTFEIIDNDLHVPHVFSSNLVRRFFFELTNQRFRTYALVKVLVSMEINNVRKFIIIQFGCKSPCMQNSHEFGFGHAIGKYSSPDAHFLTISPYDAIKSLQSPTFSDPTNHSSFSTLPLQPIFAALFV